MSRPLAFILPPAYQFHCRTWICQQAAMLSLATKHV